MDSRSFHSSHLAALTEVSASGAKYGFNSRMRIGEARLEGILWALLAAISWSSSSSPPVNVGKGCLLAIIAVMSVALGVRRALTKVRVLRVLLKKPDHKDLRCRSESATKLTTARLVRLKNRICVRNGALLKARNSNLPGLPDLAAEAATGASSRHSEHSCCVFDEKG